MVRNTLHKRSQSILGKLKQFEGLSWVNCYRLMRDYSSLLVDENKMEEKKRISKEFTGLDVLRIINEPI